MERLVKLAGIRKAEEKAARMRVLRRKREVIEKKHENLVKALKSKKEAIEMKHEFMAMVRVSWEISNLREVEEVVDNKKAAKRKRKKMAKRARKRNSHSTPSLLPWHTMPAIVNVLVVILKVA
ncbi:hypothetical protein DL98DRAFT_621213 [Cadophora sp. DSE1049]|nr:hypothetical protein DL98DRAFT_621213 [Cadophora sp. DSE1049]